MILKNVWTSHQIVQKRKHGKVSGDKKKDKGDKSLKKKNN